MLVASSMLYSNMLLRFVADLTPDCIACSLAIAAVGFLLLVVSPQSSKLSWSGLIVSLVLTYQLRPAYLFLPLLLPLLGGALQWLLSDASALRGQRRRVFVGLCAAGIVPLLAFVLLRWFVVGDLGLVAFGGNNFAGVVSCFLSEDDPPKMPPAVRPLAGAILQGRRELAESSASFPAGPMLQYREIEDQFDLATWAVCVPVAREQVGDGWPEINRSLFLFSIATIRHKPVQYGIWLAKAFVRGVYMIVSELIMNPVYLTLMLLLVVAQTCFVVRLKRSHTTVRLFHLDECFWQIHALWLVAGSFALSKLLFVIMTTPPLSRFTDAAGVFVPLVLAQALVCRIRGIPMIRSPQHTE
jgi:hypothetical protein